MPKDQISKLTKSPKPHVRFTKPHVRFTKPHIRFSPKFKSDILTHLYLSGLIAQSDDIHPNPGPMFPCGTGHQSVRNKRDKAILMHLYLSGLIAQSGDIHPNPGPVFPCGTGHQPVRNKRDKATLCEACNLCHP